MKLSSINTIKETNFHNAWARAIKFVLDEDCDIIFGDAKEQKRALDSCQKIILTKEAIEQIQNREIHPQCPFRQIDQYCQEYTREYLKNYHWKSDKERFEYLYFERLVEPIDQLAAMRKQLSGIRVRSNRCQAVTWRVEEDMDKRSPPCLQRIQLIYYDQGIDVHLSWRSRDLFGAWQPNIIALVDMLNREVVWPNGLRIARIVDDNNSLHIYDYDVREAKAVRYVSVNPMLTGGHV